ncbi:hypothetical protein CB1_000228002 [Camelus ferus]|nr:hypothetical protein CB1_000228002 [Camelus ferus]
MRAVHLLPWRQTGESTQDCLVFKRLCRRVTLRRDLFYVAIPEILQLPTLPFQHLVRFQTAVYSQQIPGACNTACCAALHQAHSGTSLKAQRILELALSGGDEGLQEEELMEQVPSTTSVVERNARIIKWLYTCKKAKETPSQGLHGPA